MDDLHHAKILGIILVLLGLIFFSTNGLFAAGHLSPEELVKQLLELKARVSELEAKVGKQEVNDARIKSELASHRQHVEHLLEGIGITGGISTFVQGTAHNEKNDPNPNESGEEADLSFSVITQ